MGTARTRQRRTILVVDDEPEVLSLLKRILASEDAEILSAGSGAKALAIARRTQLDLVILDVKLPDLSGTEVLRCLRKMDDRLPVIIVTAYGSADGVRASMRLGAFDYLTKPFDNEEIRRVAREALMVGGARRAILSEVPRGGE